MSQTLWYCIVLHGRRRCRGKEKGFGRRTFKMAKGSKALGRSNYDWNKRKGKPYIWFNAISAEKSIVCIVLGFNPYRLPHFPCLNAASIPFINELCDVQNFL